MIITDITGIGDPQILLYEGVYYCYATTPAAENQNFYVWKSTDLVNWSDKILCFEASLSWGDRDFWAPEVVYHNGRFVMHYSARRNEDNSLRLGVAVSDSPEGPFTDVYDKPMFDLGYATIDGSVLRCEHGNFFYYSRDCSENYVDGVRKSQTYCMMLDDTLTKVISEPMLMTTPTEEYELKSLHVRSKPTLWNEGPTVIKLGDKYVMNYSANYFGSNDYAICVATASHPLGPWKKSVNNPVLSCRKDLFGAGHNAFFTTKEGELYTSFHIQTDPDNPGPDRRTVIGKVSFSEKNGDIFQTIE